MKKKIFLLVFSLLCAGIVNAAILNVQGDYSTIQEGINAANNGDTVLVQPGTYVENINYNGKNITVASWYLTTQDTSYISQTVIDGDSLASVVKFENGEDSTAVLCGFTITNGYACGSSWPNQDGGGIFCRYSSPILNDLVISNNSADTLGGGVCCFMSSPILANIMIKCNSAPKGGGGFYCQQGSSPIFKNVSIIDNDSKHGGGIFCWNSELYLYNTTIKNNHANMDGGCIHFWDCAPILKNVTITGNSAGRYGGGIKCQTASPSLENVTISGNNASHSGGGIYCDYSSFPSLENVIISGNFAHYAGGVYCDHSSPSLKNVTITSNSATYSGGGIYCLSSSPSLTNVTISGNTASEDGGGIRCVNSSPGLVNCILWNDSPQEIYFYPDYDPNSITISYSDIEGGEAGIVTNNNGIVYWLDGNIDADPLFADPLNGDYHLSWTNFPIPDSTMSPCIDSGDPSSPPDPDGTIADMGAYYFNQNVGVDDPEDISDCTIYNFPNPTKNSTTILYSLKRNSHVTISIYNIKGQLVETIINETKLKGEHAVLYNTDTLNSGVYFYKIQTDDMSEIRKMIVIK